MHITPEVIDERIPKEVVILDNNVKYILIKKNKIILSLYAAFDSAEIGDILLHADNNYVVVHTDNIYLTGKTWAKYEEKLPPFAAMIKAMYL